MEAILKERGIVHEEVLLEAVASRLVEEGKSRTGLKLRFADALKDKRFMQGEEGVTLAEAAKAKAK